MMKNKKLSLKKRDLLKVELAKFLDSVIMDTSTLYKPKDGLKVILENIQSEPEHMQENILYGLRTEKMFSYVASALGQCQLIKSEDSGDLISEKHIALPDYRIITNESKTILVEVKNIHKFQEDQKIKISKKQFEGLCEYSKLCGHKLFYAIYLSKLNLWHLLPQDAFTLNGNHYQINMENCMKHNFMCKIFGDEMIGVPYPIELLIEVDTWKKQPISKNHFTINAKIKKFKVLCSDVEVKNNIDLNIVFYLFRFGSWEYQEPELVDSDDGKTFIRYLASPHNPGEENFSLIGFKSSFISAHFKEATTNKKGKVSIFTPSQDICEFGVKIPNDYLGTDIGLFRFNIEPNS